MARNAGLLVSACLSVWLISGVFPVVAQEPPTSLGSFKSRGVSPEATKVLAPQANGRGRLMPLHAASVLEWLCGDPNVLRQLGGDRKACYAEMRKGLGSCEEQLQTNLPVARSKVAATGKPDIVTFRRQLRDCFQQNYIQRQVAAGKLVTEPTVIAVDPLAVRMGGQ